MTVATQTARHVITANGVTTRFDFTFQVQLPAQLYVGLDQAIISTGFTVVLNPDQQATPGGYVDFVTPPANGQRVTMFRWTSFTQEMSYSAYDPFPAKSHERALDTLAMQIQQMEDQIQRSYKVPWWVTDEEIPPPGGTAGDITFPPPKPGYTLVWNATGTGFDNAPSENSFLEWVTQAETAASAAAQSAVEADASAALAEKWADLFPGEVVPGRYSSLFWATRAQEWAESPSLVAGVGYSARYWADQAAGWVNGALETIVSDDPEMISIAAGLNTATLNIHSNRAYGTVKLTSNGLIPPELLPAGGVTLVGPYRGDDLCPKYADEAGACVEPDYRNPSQRFPDHVFHTGNSFIIIMEATQTSGHVNAINPDTETEEPIEVFQGDGLIYFEKDILDGTTVVIKAGWHVERGWVTGGAVLATDVLYDNSLGYWQGQNVQTVLDEIGQKVVTLAGAQTISGWKTFTGGVGLANDTALYFYDTVGNPQAVLLMAASNAIYIGHTGHTAYLQSLNNPTWFDGVTPRELATKEWVTAQGQFDVNAPHTWGGEQTFTPNQYFNSYIVSQNSGVDGSPNSSIIFQTAAYGTAYRHLILSSVSSVPSNSFLDFYICSGAGTWGHALRLNGNGFVGIGGIDPVYPLQVNGGAYVSLGVATAQGSMFNVGPYNSGIWNPGVFIGAESIGSYGPTLTYLAKLSGGIWVGTGGGYAAAIGCSEGVVAGFSSLAGVADGQPFDWRTLFKFKRDYADIFSDNGLRVNNTKVVVETDPGLVIARGITLNAGGGVSWLGPVPTGGGAVWSGANLTITLQSAPNGWVVVPQEVPGQQTTLRVTSRSSTSVTFEMIDYAGVPVPFTAGKLVVFIASVIPYP